MEKQEKARGMLKSLLKVPKGVFAMSRPEQHVQIAKSVKVIDWLKTEMLDQQANLFKGLHHANQHIILDSLASLVMATYVMARRLGYSYREIDQVVIHKLREHIREGHQLEEWYGDLSALDDYINKR
ncbi:hypothetical protein JIR001_31750 [Polycladomyces abyssicola]|uniref:MazG-like nucleotide pyrophosphohydrolase family protein n=1 Tax=Polycladomyces abyssicola TaxID=1125966 RepID=A0A8D5UKH2_9BACL|nr:MazG-like family protein [Polycladomyces abyssicola]BCU83392.1 hypothetical protein JIR001_31750 [Polycladomyces abyssicola]